MRSWPFKYLEHLEKALFTFLFCFPLFGINIPGMILMGTSLWALIQFKKLKFRVNLNFFLWLLFPTIYLVHWLLSPSEVAAFALEKKLSLFFMPLVFLFPWKQFHKTSPLQIFLASNSILVAGIMFYLLIFGLSPEIDSSSISFKIRTTIEQLTDIHPTYLGMMSVFSCLLSSLYLIKKSSTNKLIYWLLAFLHIGFLLLIANRMAFITLPLGWGLLIFHGTRKNFQLTPLIVFLSIFLIGGVFHPSSLERIGELTNQLNAVEGLPLPDSRRSIYYCAIEILKEHWLWGVGTGNIQEFLNACYYFINDAFSVTNTFNTHNEYLNIWIGTGLIGITTFVAILARSIRASLSNIPFQLFLLITVFYCFTENILERQIGVWFFALWSCYFLFFHPNKEVEIAH